MSSDQVSALKQAVQYINKGNTAKASKIIFEVLQTSPENAAAWYLASLVTADKNERMRALQHAIAAAPGYTPAVNALARLMPSKDVPVEPLPVINKLSINRRRLMLGTAIIGFALIIVVIMCIYSVNK